MRCSSIRQNDGDRSQADAEGEETDAEHRPVERNARIWVDGPDGTQRRERGQRHGDGTGEKRAHHDRGEDADKTVSGNRPWSGAQAPQDRGLLLGITKLTGDELKADEQRGQGSNPAEYSEGNGQRLDGSIDLGLDGRDGVKSVGIARRRCCGELPLHLVDVAAPAVESEPVRNGAFSPPPATICRPKRGVKKTNVGYRSMSSWTMALLCCTSPTSMASKRICGGTLAVPKPGRLSWSGV